MDLDALVPRHKGDLAAARAAVAAGYTVVKPVLPRLLEWHQDYNWPVAHILNDLYRDADEDIIPHLQRILSSEDMSWRYWIVALVIPQIRLSAALHFVPELERLSDIPTDPERENELDDVARESLKSIKERQG